MARQTIIELIDDLDGGKADESMVFVLDGQLYQIDLSEENANKLRGLLAPYAAAGTRLGRAPKPATPAPAAATPPVKATRKAPAKKAAPAAPRGQKPPSKADKDKARKWARESAAGQAWAQEAGVTVGDRGRVASVVVDAWRAWQARDIQPAAQKGPVALAFVDALNGAKAGKR